MPSNEVLINQAIRFIVSDSKMDELLGWLNLNAQGKWKKHTNNSLLADVAKENSPCTPPES